MPEPKRFFIVDMSESGTLYNDATEPMTLDDALAFVSKGGLGNREEIMILECVKHFVPRLVEKTS